MYWGDGFSLNDLKNQFAQKDINHVFEKLNIPKVNRVYGHYLKFSDVKYNERFSATMSQKRKAIKQNRKQTQKENNEKTKRGPLSQEHRQKISQSLIEYYKNNPKQASELTEENLKRFKTQEEKVIFSQVMLRTWKYPETRSVKKAMSRYMKQKEITQEELETLTNEDSILRKNLKGFFSKNPWAKTQLSKAMIKSWERQKELGEMGLIFEPTEKLKLVPTKMAQRIEKISKTPNLAKNLELYIPDERDLGDDEKKILFTVGNKEIQLASEKLSLIMKENVEGLSDSISNVLLTFLIHLAYTLKNMPDNFSLNNKADKEVCGYIYNNIIKKILVGEKTRFKANELQHYYLGALNIYYNKYKQKSSVKNFNYMLDSIYEHMINSNANEIAIKNSSKIGDFVNYRPENILETFNLEQ